MKNRIYKKLAIVGALFSISLASLLPVSMAGAVTEAECKCGESGQVNSLECGALCAKSGDNAGSLFGPDGIFKKITDTALFLIGAISVVMLIYGGIRYTVSGGESGAVTNAKNTILYAIVGIVVSILAYAAVQFVVGQLV